MAGSLEQQEESSISAAGVSEARPPSGKRCYRAPRLEAFGAICQITGSGSGEGPDLLFGSGAPGT